MPSIYYVSDAEGERPGEAYQVKNRDLHHTLIKVRRAIFDDFDGDDFLGLQVLAFNDLTEGSLAKNIQNKITVPDCRFPTQPPGAIVSKTTATYSLIRKKKERETISLLVACFFGA